MLALKNTIKNRFFNTGKDINDNQKALSSLKSKVNTLEMNLKIKVETLFCTLPLEVH